MTPPLRAATVADLTGITDTFLACWHGSYAAVLPRRLTDAMTRPRALALWTRVLETAAPGEVVVQPAPDGSGAVLGVTRWAMPPGGGTGTVHSLYVSPLAQGHGTGTALLTAATSALRDAGATAATLWVFRDNAPSVAFYRGRGWLPDGAERTQEEFGEPEIRLARALGPASADGAAA
ncbi:GNAT family N-acetyltransferase [Streptomyces sp. NPDC049879]|uniref:GNAT family N-acetyltransferase n=1 Tax=Streptomyces sp. NPDC049879 TaxID=3365598 RepID=UPI0037BCD0BB